MSDETSSKRYRAPNKIMPTEATAKFLRYFLGPFIENFRYAEGHEERVEGYIGFFNAHSRRVCYCKAKQSFKMPGLLWRSPSEPFRLIEGTGRRYVKKDEGFVLRIDKNMPDICEIEFDEQVFVLSEANYEFIKDYVGIVA